MAKTVGTSDLLEVLGSDRVANGAPALVTPSLTTIERGFYYDPTIPSSAVINSNNVTWASTVLGEKINHVLQNGVPQWVSTTTYAIGNVVNRTNSLWIALASNTNSAPTDVNANWVRIADKSYVDLSSPAPNGYLYAPVPNYDSAQPKRVNFNGALTARSQDNTTNIVLSSASRNLDLATNGANGLADGLTVANNTWYYVYAYSGGYVASTTNGASTLTIASVSQKVVQLPLALRTDGSANILPFYMDVWRGKSSRLRYKTTFYVSGSITATTLIGLVSSATYSAFSLASFVPPLSTTAILLCGSRGTGAGYIRATGETPDYGFDLVNNVHFTELQVPTNTSQSIDARITASGMDLAVVGYSINL